MKKIILFICVIISLIFNSCTSERKTKTMVDIRQTKFYNDSKPWTRWWWFASMIDKASIADNLAWLKENGFGGVEVAWVYPLNRLAGDTINYTPRQEWQSKEWSEIVAYAKQCADSLGLGCDFTFGTLWPFGDTKVPFDEATMNLKDPKWRQDITRSWEYPKSGYVIDHLNSKAFRNYAQRMGNALKSALQGNISGLFCDSWEVETKHLSTIGFKEKFLERYGYKINDYIDSLYSNSEPYRYVRYDYMKLISEYTIEEFYKQFTEESHELGSYSRVQCCGAPCDIISAYSVVDIPESEALLYEPSYSNIVASAASLSGKNVVTSETFTCLYGWPDIHRGEEQTADLKLLADALFANGINHIIWHGKPYNLKGQDTTKFYASVHVGKSGSLAEEIPAFNKYMETISSYMKKGRNYSDVAVYLPTEDSWVAGELPLDKQFIWAWGEYEQRYTYLPEELKGYRPLWINSEFLQKAQYKNGLLTVGDLAFKSLYIDVKYMDIVALTRILALAKEGLPICLKQIPADPSFKKIGKQYIDLLEQLKRPPNVKSSWSEIEGNTPLLSGLMNFDYWCRETDDGLYLFFANPTARNLKFPLEYGQSLNYKKQYCDISINYHGKSTSIKLEFAPYQSLLMKIDKNGIYSFIDITFVPKAPVFIPRVKKGKDKWEIQ
jgi:alpha-L-rhamnosidase